MMYSKIASGSAAALVAFCAAGCHGSNVQRTASQSVPTPQTAPSTESTLSDSEVQSGVLAELRRDKKIDESRVHVAVKNGIVALTGRVDNLLSKSRAGRIAESVRGVRSVSNRVDIEPVPRPDGDIGRDVEEALRYDEATAKMPIHVAVKDAVVTLSGTVQSWQEEQLAERIADGVRGVKQVQNDLKARFGVKRADDAIVADIRSRLSWDALVENDPVGVSVKDGKVTLSGSVGSAAEESRAIADAWVDGVTGVDPSQLEVRWWDPYAEGWYLTASRTAASDADLERRIDTEIRRSPFVPPDDVHVQVKDGKATLTGTVATSTERQTAGSDALQAGAKAVDNELKID